MKIPFEDMPTWMRRARQTVVDWGVVLVILFSLLAAWPFLLQGGLPRTNATENHVFMAADYATAFREGRLYPRWSAAALSGYGAPIPHYYPPGAAYSAATIELLFTDDTVVAVRLVYVFALVLAGAMTYVFVLRWGGARAGILAGLLYVYSPYVGFTAPHVLGDLPGVIGLALLPALLWSVHRLLLSNRTLDFLLVALTTGAFVTTAPRTLLAAGGLAVGLLSWYLVTHDEKKRVLWVILAAGAGFALASFHWLPALWEQDAVRWQSPPLEAPAWTLNASELFTPLRRVDLSELLVTPQFTVGITGVVFAALGAVTIFWERKGRRLYALFLGSGLLILLVAVTIFSEETWLLGPATWCLAVAGSAVITLYDRIAVRYRRLLLPTLLVGVLLASIPVWLAPRWPESFGGTGEAEQILYEQQEFGIAVLPPGADIPTTLPDLTTPDRVLVQGYRSGRVERISPGQLSYESQALWVASGTHYDHYVVNTAALVTFDVLRAGFPGWQATLEGETLNVQTDSQTGLLQVTVPESHAGHLLIRLGSTSIRRAAWIVSWGTLLLLLGDMGWRLRQQEAMFYEDLTFIRVQETRLLFIVLGGFVLGIALFATPESPYSLHARPGHGLDDTVELRARTDVGLETLAYQFEKTEYHVGDTLDFSIAWRTSRPLLRNYGVQVYLLDASQQLHWSQVEPRYPGYYPTRRWRTNAYVRDFYHIPLISTLRPGEYRVAIEVYDCAPECTRDNQLSFFDDQGQFIGQTLILPAVITIAP